MARPKKLSPQTVRTIFKSTEPASTAAGRFKVSQNLIYLIRAGRVHRDITKRLKPPERARRQRSAGPVNLDVKRLADAKPYVAPNHRDCSALRLFGAEAGGTKGLVFGYSHFLPGGGAGPDASPPEKVYFVLRGELTVIVNGKETVLKANDSCVIEPNETREIINRGNEVCSIVVAVANPPK